MKKMTYEEFVSLITDHHQFPMVEKITDQEVLRKIAIFRLSASARLSAINQLNDPRILASLIESSYEDTTKIAIEKITDFSILSSILRGGYDDICGVADCHVYYSIAIDTIINNKTEIDEQIKQAFLFEVMAMDTSNIDNIRLIALNSLTNQTLLANIALNDKNRKIRKIAREKCSQHVYEEALLLAPPPIKRRHLFEYLKLRLCGTSFLCKMKRIRDNREVTPILLQKLDEAIPEWSITIEECSKLQVTKTHWETMLAKLSGDITEWENTLDLADDPDMRESCSFIIASLHDQKAIAEKTLRSVSTLLKETQNKKEKMLSLFHTAERAASTYKKYDQATSNVLEHQSEMKELLLQTSTHT